MANLLISAVGYLYSRGVQQKKEWACPSKVLISDGDITYVITSVCVSLRLLGAFGVIHPSVSCFLDFFFASSDLHCGLESYPGAAPSHSSISLPSVYLAWDFPNPAEIAWTILHLGSGLVFLSY